MTDMTVSETLNKAADLIEERGWSSGGGWHDLNDSEPLCIEGAIAAAQGAASGVGYRCAAYFAVRDHIGESPWIWNDHLMHGSSVDDLTERRVGWVRGSREAAYSYAVGRVIATLLAAAVIAESREAESTLIAEVPC